MRARTIWTPELDGLLRSLRDAGRTWDGIAAEMGLGRNTVLERGRKIGARRVPVQAEVIVEESKDRAARVAGYPACWSLLTDETPLAGEAYPFPVFL